MYKTTLQDYAKLLKTISTLKVLIDEVQEKPNSRYEIIQGEELDDLKYGLQLLCEKSSSCINEKISLYTCIDIMSKPQERDENDAS